MSTATGFTLRHPDGTLDVRSVGDSPRMVQVNALITLCRVMTYNETTDETIAAWFDDLLGGKGYTIVPVTITETPAS